MDINFIILFLKNVSYIINKYTRLIKAHQNPMRIGCNLKSMMHATAMINTVKLNAMLAIGKIKLVQL